MSYPVPESNGHVDASLGKTLYTVPPVNKHYQTNKEQSRLFQLHNYAKTIK